VKDEGFRNYKESRFGFWPVMVLAEQALCVARGSGSSNQPPANQQQPASPSKQPTASEAPALPGSEYQVTKKPGSANELPWGSPKHAPYVPYAPV